MLHADIKTKAATDTGKPVHPGQIPPSATLPAIAYRVNFDTSEGTMQQANGPTKVIATFEFMAHNFDDLETVGNALFSGFSGFGGPMGALSSPDTRTHVLKGAKLIADQTEPQIYEWNGARAFLRTMSFSLTHR
jgi:hypothetical protein